MNDYASLITLISTVLAVVALVLAFLQTRDLNRIRNSLSTRYLGGLSDYYPLVIEKIKSAHKSIEILSDFPAYGCFTNPDLWHAYHYALTNKRLSNKKVSIMMECQDDEFRKKADGEFFKEAKKDWNAWRMKPENAQRLYNFLNYMSYENKNIEELEEDTFFGLIKKADELMMKECFSSKRDVREVKAVIRLDFWIFDRGEAIFAFTNYAHGSSRAGFYTTDPRLIYALRDIADSYPSTTP